MMKTIHYIIFLAIGVLIGSTLLLTIKIVSLEETMEAVGQRQETWGHFIVKNIDDEAYENRERMFFIATEIILPTLKPYDQTPPTKPIKHQQ